MVVIHNILGWNNKRLFLMLKLDKKIKADGTTSNAYFDILTQQTQSLEQFMVQGRRDFSNVADSHKKSGLQTFAIHQCFGIQVGLNLI